MDKISRITLAALLDKIKKFWQRTPKSDDDKSWREEFVDCYVPNGWYVEYPQIIDFSNNLAAGDPPDHTDSQVPLSSIFDQVQIDTKIPLPKEKHFYSLGALDLTATNFFLDRPEIRLTTQDYKTAWDAFIADLEKCPRSDFTAYLTTLYYLLQKHTWCIPAAHTSSSADVSLFALARTSAAIANCLADTEIANCLADAEKKKWWLLVGGDVSGIQDFIYTITSKGAAKGLRGRSFYLQLLTEAIVDWLLARWDLPIVNALYVGGGSFYLLAPVDKQKDLPKVQQEISRRLLAIHHGDLYVAVAGEPLAAADFAGAVFSQKWHAVGKALGAVKRTRFRELGTEMWSEIFEPRPRDGREWQQIIEPGGEIAPTNTPNICPICQNEPGTVPQQGRYDAEGRKVQIIGALCHSLEKLGEDLGHTDKKWLVKGRGKERKIRSGAAVRWYSGLAAFGARAFLEASPKERHYMRQVTAYRINDTKMDILCDGGERAYAFRFIARTIPHRAPTPEEQAAKPKHPIIADFSDMAGYSEGITRLGVLRMDVDNLGQVFRQGLGDSATIARVSSLSFFMQLFFDGYLNEICQQFNKFDVKEGTGKDRLYVTYAGGDDLFIVGAWDTLPKVAQKIHDAFCRFVGGNENLTISAGVTIVPPKFPVYQAAELAHEALDNEAKGMTRQRGGREVQKDAISFLGKTLGWEDFETARDFADKQLLPLLDKLPRGFLTKLRQIYALYARNRRRVVDRRIKYEKHEKYELKHKPPAGGLSPAQLPEYQQDIRYHQWIWRMVYSLTQEAAQYQDHKNEIEGIREWIMADEHIAYLDLPLRWVELVTREKITEK